MLTAKKDCGCLQLVHVLVCLLAVVLGPALVASEPQPPLSAGGQGMAPFALGDPRNCLQNDPDLRIMQVRLSDSCWIAAFIVADCLGFTIGMYSG